MKKIRIMYLKTLSLFILLLFSDFIYSQEHQHKMTDTNPIYSVEGEGYNETGVKKMMIFSTLSTQGENKEEIVLNNNEITINKNGVYRISLSSEINKEKKEQQQPVFSVNINGKEAFIVRQNSLSANGEYYFQIQLKKGDVLSFDTAGEAINKMGKNNLSIRFTDPGLITFSEETK